MAVEYVSGFQVILSPVKKRGPSWYQLAPGQGQDGYGRKIHTDYKIKLPDNSRLFRVYCVCFSNVASFYISKGGQDYYLRDSELQEGRDRARNAKKDAPND